MYIFLEGNRCTFFEKRDRMNTAPLQTAIDLTGNPDPSSYSVIALGVAMSNPDNVPTKRRENGLCSVAKNPVGQQGCVAYAEKSAH